MMLLTTRYALALSTLLLVLSTSVHGHPGAVADGRATCGSEYSTHESAYEIPDMKESWYIRRVATCESPVFWTSFDVVDEGQEIYFAVISPEIARFEDKLRFHALLYGPGIVEDLSNGFSAVPENLPSSVEVFQNLGGVAYLQPPDSWNNCDFVDTNPVMKTFSDLIDGRCMEQLTYDDYDEALQQGMD